MDRRSRRRPSPLALALVLALGAATTWVTWRASSAGDSGEGTVEEASRGAVPISSDEPTLTGMTPAVPTPGPARESKEAAAPSPGDVARIEGRVRNVDGTSAGGGIAWAISRVADADPWRVLARGIVNTDGTFLLEVASSSDTPWMRQVGIGIAIDGQQAVGAWAQAEIGKTTPFDLVLPSVPLVRGRVLDPDGRPVAGLRLRHTDRGANRIRVSLSDLPVEREMARNSTSFARTVTDAEGRFALHLVDRDVHDGSLFVPSGFLSESAEWFLDDPRETLVRLGVMPRLPREEIALVARPALALTGRVVDAASGEPVAAFESHAHRAGTTDYVAFDGTEGRLGLCWPRWWEADEGGQVDLSLEAKGYVPVEVPVRYARGERSANVDVRLVPLGRDDTAVLELEVVDWKGRPFDGPWWVTIVDPAHSLKTIQDLGLPERKEAGRYVLSAPPGRWTLRVKPNDSLGWLDWMEPVDLRPGPNRLRCAMRPHGALVVRWPVDSQVASLIVSPGTGGMSSGVSHLESTGEFRSDTCLEGDYEVRFMGPYGTPSKKVRVRAGEETVVDASE